MNQHPIIENAISNLSSEFKTWGMSAKKRIELRNKLITELEKENELDEGIEEKGPDSLCRPRGFRRGVGGLGYQKIWPWLRS